MCCFYSKEGNCPFVGHPAHFFENSIELHEEMLKIGMRQGPLSLSPSHPCVIASFYSFPPISLSFLQFFIDLFICLFRNLAVDERRGESNDAPRRQLRRAARRPPQRDQKGTFPSFLPLLFIIYIIYSIVFFTSFLSEVLMVLGVSSMAFILRYFPPPLFFPISLFLSLGPRCCSFYSRTKF